MTIPHFLTQGEIALFNRILAKYNPTGLAFDHNGVYWVIYHQGREY
jgi:hypothetical protein